MKEKEKEDKIYGKIKYKNGKEVSIEDWIREEEENQKNKEYREEEKKEIQKKRKMIKREENLKIRTKYDKSSSNVRVLTDEEVIKGYIIKEDLKSKSIIYDLISFLKKLNNRKVFSGVIVSAIKSPRKSVSSNLTRLFKANIVVRTSVKSEGNKYLWGLNPFYKDVETEEIKSIYNKSIVNRTKEKNRIEDSKEEETEEESILKKKKILRYRSLRIVIEGDIEDIFSFINRIIK